MYCVCFPVIKPGDNTVTFFFKGLCGHIEEAGVERERENFRKIFSNDRSKTVKMGFKCLPDVDG